MPIPIPIPIRVRKKLVESAILEREPDPKAQAEAVITALNTTFLWDKQKLPYPQSDDKLNTYE